MARAGLGPQWTCAFANDFDKKKAKVYHDAWGVGVLKTCDVKALTTSDLPGQPDLVWASFPCQDLSLAGGGAGLKGDRSGTFWPFWELMMDLKRDGRQPKMVALENVYGTLTSHGGKDFTAICKALGNGGYRFGAMIINAELFVPHSRPRLFIIAVDESVPVPSSIVEPGPMTPWHPRALLNAKNALPDLLQQSWIWWKLKKPRKRRSVFSDLIEKDPKGVGWHTEEETNRLLGMMGSLHLEKVEKAKATKRLQVGTVYRRTRVIEANERVQRAEVRFDQIAGCLRTPAGGSSRQVILIVEGETVRSRLISPRETARLMGLPDSYKLPSSYNEAYHLTGDGVVVPVVRHIAKHIIEPIILPPSEGQLALFAA